MDELKRARLIKEMEAIFLPDYDAQNMPSADKRAAYALEHIAYRMGRLDEKLAQLLAAIPGLTARAEK